MTPVASPALDQQESSTAQQQHAGMEFMQLVVIPENTVTGE